MKKILSIILTVFMMFSIGTMVACKDDNDSSSSSDIAQTLSLEDKVKNEIIELAIWEAVDIGKINGETLVNAWVNEWYSAGGSANDYRVSGRMVVKTYYGVMYYNTFEVSATYNSETDEVDLGDFKYLYSLKRAY